MPKFLIHPSDLEKRRKRCHSVVATLLKFQREVVTACNVCGSSRQVVLTRGDRYGLPVRNALCLDCGLFYLIDRFESSGYSEFYASGAYRTVSCQFNGVTHTIGQVQANQVSYAKGLVRALSGFVPRVGKGTLLDVGGSAGIVARELVREFDLQGTVLDPATDEIAAARAAGLNAVVGSLEDWQTDDKFDLILLCRSIEHLFDLRLSMTRIRGLLKPNGLFFVDIADFMEMCRMFGAPESFTKIDHCYWLTQSTALNIFRTVGFELVSMNILSSFGYVGFLLRACEPPPGMIPATERICSQVEEIQKIERDWRNLASTARGPIDWLHRAAYRAKRRMVRLLASPGHQAQPAENTVAAVPIPESPKSR